jgi:vesicle coat complex subunit
LIIKKKLRGQRPDSFGDKGCFDPLLSTIHSNQLKQKNFESKMDDENQKTEEEDSQRLPNFIYTIPAALAAAGERGKFNQILTANQMSINLMDSKTLRSLFGPLLKHSKKEINTSDEDEKNCKGFVYIFKLN